MFIIFCTQKKFDVSKFQMTASFIQDLTFSQFHHDLVMNQSPFYSPYHIAPYLNKIFLTVYISSRLKKKSSLPFAKSYEKLHLTTLRGFVDRREKFLSDILQIINPLATQYDQTNSNKKKKIYDYYHSMKGIPQFSRIIV